MMADMAATIVAPESGLYRPYSSESFYLDGDSGTEWFGTHLSGHIVTTEQRVARGQPIALNGNSGNASGGSPHLHLEQRPGHGEPVNPYPAMYDACFAPEPVLASAEAAVPRPTYPFTRMEVHYWWNHTHYRIDGPTARVLTAFFNAIVRGRIIAYVTAISSIPNEARWDRVAACESGGNWSINTGNGYYGGLQFSLGTWQAYGGSGYPHQNSKRAQVIVAERVRTQSGLHHWPHCGPRWYG
jgi:hypothetical protein